LTAFRRIARRVFSPRGRRSGTAGGGPACRCDRSETRVRCCLAFISVGHDSTIVRSFTMDLAPSVSGVMDEIAPAKASEISPQFKVIIGLAGGPGDRRSGHRMMVGREESPDTVLSHQGKTLIRLARMRAMGNAPGNARGAIGDGTGFGLYRPIRSRKVPQKMYRPRHAARWHRAGKPARRLRTARFVWQG